MSSKPEKKEDFPNTIFVTDLPKSFTLSELSEFLEKYGPIMEIERMPDEHIRVRFNSSDDARKCFVKARKKELEFKKTKIGIIPKNLKKQGQHP
ncbi:hypothetical protein M9Y10_009239 [Tritrichomonas musculus]|uniref:RRM domain-containing protein n=1 Tax=Tritrichomonas musculus TaxID=1915356 RepID=A0ABR2IP04_9EUKA